LETGQPPQIQTPYARIKAKKVVLAINAWMASQFKQFSRAIAVVSSDMAITKPCPERLAMVGLSHGASICDSRIFVHYFHTTNDGRLMMGKGGNTFAYGSKMIPSFFEASRYEDQLHQAIKRFFPSLGNVSLDASWNGGSDRSVTGFPFFGFLDDHPAITYGFGYSGNGVVQSYIGGQILRSLVLELDDPWSRCGFVGGPRGVFPPEPVKWLGSMMVRDAIRRKENAEDAGKQPFWVDTYLSTFAKSASKADK
jgi:glycine/D-amino acid oxidase-like deaminating enzyme